ncbi:MAG: hypothetical protein IJH32_06270 [Ruminococcus sp.]|nr:hypothetical protein [Ruminococcus sp.]
MASTNHTPNLGLCQWAASDKPKRADFVSDNSIIDTALGGHIANAALHLTASEKAKLNESFVVRAYAGTGESSRAITVDFQPTLALVYKKNAPPVSYSSGNILVNFAVAAYGFGGSSGLSVTSTGITVSQASVTGGVGVDLNVNEEQYVAVIFK